MSIDDMKINKQVRALLVRNYYQTELLHFTSKGGVVNIKGTLKKVIGGKEIRASDIDSLEQAISSVPRVRGVIFDFDGWSNDAGMWKQKDGHNNNKKKRGGAAQNNNYFTV